MAAIDVPRALQTLGLAGSQAAPPTAEALRRAYLRLALATHPDKNPGDAGAAARFAELQAAHSVLLEAAHAGEALLAERERSAALLDLMMRALGGEDVEAQLQALGEYRPPAAFGVDPAVRFDARLPSDGGSSDGEEAVDVQQAFKEAFKAEGLTDEGDPVGGFELPPDYEMM